MTFGDLFISLFLLSLICAAISTISALMHTIGAAGGYDLYTLIKNKKGMEGDSKSVNVNRIVIVIMLVLVVVYCYLMPKDIIAKATSVFMGMTAAALLPAYFHALYAKKNPCKSAAITSIVAGTGSYLFSALFLNTGMSIFLPICKLITGEAVLFPDSIISSVDPLIISLPLSIITMALALVYFRRKEVSGTTA